MLIIALIYHCEVYFMEYFTSESANLQLFPKFAVHKRQAKSKTDTKMKVKELVEKLNLKVLSGEKGLDREIDGCYISDLLSDVMGNAMEGNIWITLQTHKNVMAVASLKEMSCIILVKNLMPNDETIEQSNDEDLPILQTSLPTYEIAGLVYNLLNK